MAMTTALLSDMGVIIAEDDKDMLARELLRISLSVRLFDMGVIIAEDDKDLLARELLRISLSVCLFGLFETQNAHK